jgi:hypothetical protein
VHIERKPHNVQKIRVEEYAIITVIGNDSHNDRRRCGWHVLRTMLVTPPVMLRTAGEVDGLYTPNLFNKAQTF